MNLPLGVRLHSPDLGPLYADGWALRSAAGLLALDAPVVVSGPGAESVAEQLRQQRYTNVSVSGPLAEVLANQRQWWVACSDSTEWLRGLPDGIFHAAVTSPPYAFLRSYLPAGHPDKAKEMGSEPTLKEYLRRMVLLFRELRRALRDDGCCFVNMGDTYGKKGQLLGVPWLLKRALEKDGWVCRSVIVWAKPSPMPGSQRGWRWEQHKIRVRAQAVNPNSKKYEAAVALGGSVNQGSFKQRYETGNGKAEFIPCPGCEKCRDNNGLVLRKGKWRPTSAWEPVFMLTKGGCYFSDGEPVRTPSARPGDVQTFGKRSKTAGTFQSDDPEFRNGAEQWGRTVECAGGANLRDVWTICAESLHERHYAAFPRALVRNCLLSSTSERGVCGQCGAPLVRVLSEATGGTIGKSWTDHSVDQEQGGRGKHTGEVAYSTYQPGKTLGFRPSCQCNSEVIPALLCDPFSGSGRTGVVCRQLGLRFLGCDLSEEYVSLANRKIEAALRQTKRKKADESPSLFSSLEG